MILVNDRDQIPWRKGMTVQDLLDDLGYSYVLITVTVGDDLVPESDYRHHVLPDDARVTVFHLAHGG